MAALGIIGGTALSVVEDLRVTRREVASTPFGEPSAPLLRGSLADVIEVVFLPRHGERQQIPPHRINYRANLWALQQAGVTHVLAIAAVGGIRRDLLPGSLVIPDQIIDYTWGRAGTFFEEDLLRVVHIDFTEPFCCELRGLVLQAGREAGLELVEHGTYGATPGPRLETAAEIDRMERDGCAMVGMTGMPEAALARELGLRYSSCAVVVNSAAGRGESRLSIEDMTRQVHRASGRLRLLVAHLASRLAPVLTGE